MFRGVKNQSVSFVSTPRVRAPPQPEFYSLMSAVTQVTFLLSKWRGNP